MTIFTKSVSSTILTLLLLFSSLPRFAETAKACMETGKVREFKSLLEFQKNNISFDPNDEMFQGNNVNIETQTDVVIKYSFIALDSHFIFKMNLENQKIRKIEDDSFYELLCLHDLSLYNNKLETLTRGTFYGLTQLRRLNLGNNLMQEVPENVFMYVGDLKILNLTRNNIAILHDKSFNGINNLKSLDLSCNDLHHIIPEAFQYFMRLQNLQIGSNQIAYANFSDWKNMNNLNVLNLTDNVLAEFDWVYGFPFALTLKELYLGKNFITVFYASAVSKALPSLEVLDISENPLSCLNVFAIWRDLNQTKVKQVGKDDNPEEPTFSGISCNKSVKWYERRKARPIHIPTSPSPIVSLTKDPSQRPDPPTIDESNIMKLLMKNINKLYAIMFSLFGIVFTYILCDLFSKAGYCRWAINKIYMYYRSGPPQRAEPEHYYDFGFL